MPVPVRLRAAIERLSQATDETLRAERQRLVDAEVPPPKGDSLTFLGTGGNPTNLVGQQRATAGFYLALDDFSLYVDPGPGAIVYAHRFDVELRNLSCLFISHGHTDHVLSAGAVIEAMCRGMTKRRGWLLAPREVLESGAVSAYHQGGQSSRWYPGGPEAVVALTPGTEVRVAEDVRIRPVTALHGGENYGFRLEGRGRSLGYTSDTRYLLRYRTWEGGEEEVRPGEKLRHFEAALAVEESLVAAFTGVEVLVVNVSFFDQHAHRHVTAFGAADLLRRTGARLGVLTHFDPSLGQPAERADEVAEIVAELAGTEVIAARDGLRLDLRALLGDRGTRAGGGSTV
jgi:hypothetical protein